jgi:hypothetical protein
MTCPEPGPLVASQQRKENIVQASRLCSRLVLYPGIPFLVIPQVILEQCLVAFVFVHAGLVVEVTVGVNAEEAVERASAAETGKYQYIGKNEKTYRQRAGDQPGEYNDTNDYGDQHPDHLVNKTHVASHSIRF